MNCVASPASLFVCGSASLRLHALRPQLKRDPLGSMQPRTSVSQFEETWRRTLARNVALAASDREGFALQRHSLRLVLPGAAFDLWCFRGGHYVELASL